MIDRGLKKRIQKGGYQHAKGVQQYVKGVSQYAVFLELVKNQSDLQGCEVTL
jgi:hypothetical protein